MRSSHHLRSHRLITTAAGIAAAAVLSACGGDSGASEIVLSSRGEAGRDVARSNGCAACHGRNGEGSPGPEFIGLYGSTVEFEDGTSTVADDEYLYEAIADPNARLVEGYGFPMPDNRLDDEEIAQVIAYIRDLTSPDDTTTGTQP